MTKYELLGAKHFVTKPKGTLFIPFWCSEEICSKKIQQFNDNDFSFIDWSQLHIYIDNSYSACLDADEENLIWCYDMNVVGDSSPTETLYLVIPVESLPNQIYLFADDLSIPTILSKEDILKIRDKIINEKTSSEERNAWAYEYLCTSKYHKNNFIVNYKSK